MRPGDTSVNGRFASTSVPRTLLDLATRYERRALLRALAEAEFQHDLRPADVDCLWRERRVVVELDGRQHERPH